MHGGPLKDKFMMLLNASPKTFQQRSTLANIQKHQKFRKYSRENMTHNNDGGGQVVSMPTAANNNRTPHQPQQLDTAANPSSLSSIRNSMPPYHQHSVAAAQQT